MMRYKNWFYVTAATTLLLLFVSGQAAAYEPIEDLTITKIANLSDAFLYGTVVDITYDSTNRPITINELQVHDVYFDKTDKIGFGYSINVITRGGLFTNERGEQVKVNVLNAPELEKDKSYIIYLRWDSSQDAFTPASGESSVFEVDADGKVLNIHGYYILDVKDGKLVFGPPKEPKVQDMQSGEMGPPSGILIDTEGNTRVIEPSIPDVQARETAPEKLLNLQQFLAKVQKGGNNGSPK